MELDHVMTDFARLSCIEGPHHGNVFNHCMMPEVHARHKPVLAHAKRSCTVR